MARDLTPKQQAFISHYIGDCNGVGVQAARKAGYCGDDVSLRNVASKLLTNAYIAAVIAERKAMVDTEGIANRTNRVAAQNERWAALHQIRQERAADPRLASVPGAATGFVVKRLRGVGTGEDFTLVEEEAFDKGLFDAFSSLEQHTAKDLGQWTEKQEHMGKDGGPILVQTKRDLSALTLEDLHDLERIAQRAAGLVVDSAGAVDTQPA